MEVDESLPLQAKVDLWRQKVLAGTISDEELKQAVAAIREGRVAAAQLGAKRKAAKGPARSAEDMLSSFLGGEDEGGEEAS